MTKIEVLEVYKQENADFIKDCKSRKDYVMLRESWHIWTDRLCKYGVITESQYNKWLSPF